MKRFAIIVAGGSGSRLGGEKPKQFLLVNKKPILLYSVEQFAKHPQIDGIVLVVNEQFISETQEYVQAFNIQKVMAIVSGGSTRQQSVFEGLKKVKEFADDNDIVLIHDSARPLVSEKIISDNISLAEQYSSICTALPCTNTIFQSIDGVSVSSVPNRKELFEGQTPQTFKLSLIYKAHLNALQNGVVDASDDVSLVTLLGESTHLVLGSPLNYKITTSKDLIVLQSLIEQGA